MSRARTWDRNTAGPNVQHDRLPVLVAELVSRRVAVIVTVALLRRSQRRRPPQRSPSPLAVSEDPVSLGLVASLARPGGNLTGINFFSSELVAKRLELLRELVPRAARVAVLVNPANTTNTETTLRDVEPEAARAIGIQIQVFNAGTSRNIDAAFATIVRERPDALSSAQQPSLTAERSIWTLAARHAIPATYPGRQLPKSAG